MMKSINKRKNEGFTLIELIIVITIIAILGAIIFFGVGDTTKRANASVDIRNAQIIATVINKAMAEGKYIISPAAEGPIVIAQDGTFTFDSHTFTGGDGLMGSPTVKLYPGYDWYAKISPDSDKTIRIGIVGLAGMIDESQATFDTMGGAFLVPTPQGGYMGDYALLNN